VRRGKKDAFSNRSSSYSKNARNNMATHNSGGERGGAWIQRFPEGERTYQARGKFFRRVRSALRPEGGKGEKKKMPGQLNKLRKRRRHMKRGTRIKGKRGDERTWRCDSRLERRKKKSLPL